MERDSFATEKEVQEQLIAADLETLITRLEGFAYMLISNSSLEIEPLDLVMDVLLKVQTCDRKWYKNKFPDFNKFLFWAIRSHFSNRIKTSINRKEAEDGHTYIHSNSRNGTSPEENLDYDTIRKKSLEELAKLAPSVEEECVFECWLDDVYEPRLIADSWDIPVEDVYNAIKRLNRKRPIIKKQIKPYFDGR